MDGIIYVLTGLVMFAICIITNSITHFEGIAVFIFCIPLLLYSFVFLSGTIVNKIIAATVPVLLNVAISSITFTTVANLFSMTINEILSAPSLERLLFVIIANMILMYALSVIIRLVRRKKIRLSITEIVLNMSIAAISIVLFTFINWISMSVVLSIHASDLLLGCLFGIVLIDLVVFYLVSELSQKNEIKAKNELLSQQLTYQDLYTEQIKQQYKTAMHIKHDIKHSLSVLNLLVSNHEYDKAQKLLDEYMQSNSLAFILINTKNLVLNAIVTLKLTYASSLGIKTFCAFPETFDILEDVDLCNLIGNMLENAIEHCQKHLDKSNEVTISLTPSMGKYTLLVRNTVHTSVLENNKQLKTSKENKNLHGFGTEIIAEIAQKYDGLFDYYERDGMFYSRVTLFQE